MKAASNNGLHPTPHHEFTHVRLRMGAVPAWR